VVDVVGVVEALCHETFFKEYITFSHMLLLKDFLMLLLLICKDSLYLLLFDQYCEKSNYVTYT
jgi:hypothetical protein